MMRQPKIAETKEDRWDRLIAEEYGEPYTPPTKPEVTLFEIKKHPLCPYCSAKTYRVDCQWSEDHKTTRRSTGYRCFRCGGLWNLDLSPGLPIPNPTDWAATTPCGATYDTLSQNKRDRRQIKAINKQIEEHQKTITERNNNRRTRLLNHYQQGIPHCEECGNTELAILQRHHLDGNKRNNNPQNIRILCANCHWRVTMPKKSKRYQNPTLLTPSQIHPHIAPGTTNYPKYSTTH